MATGKDSIKVLFFLSGFPGKKSEDFIINREV